MKLNYSHIRLLFLAIIILITTSCSTKKKSWVNRQYHNTTAKYNGYFNGNQSIKSGVRKLHNSNVDDYTKIISVFPNGDLKNRKQISSYMSRAIQKGSVVIQRHSMKIKGREYCKWIDDNYLMIGVAYFYKGEFNDAIKTFSFIKNEYTESKVRYKASLWLVRAYVEQKKFKLAELELNEALKDKKFPKKLNKQLFIVASDFYLQKNDLTNAKSQLLMATKLIKRKSKKVRLNYILAQIYQQTDQYKLAQKQYNIVLRSSPEYEMAFNAKLNLARSLESGNPTSEKMKKKLLKMINDNKNKEYLDQIYYTIAEMEAIEGDTLSALKNYSLSALNSLNNNPQKALSFLAIAKIYFEKGDYKLSQQNYDSTIQYMHKDFRIYDQVRKRHETLTDLVLHINVVEMQDSLQMLAKLPNYEKMAIIGAVINAEREREKLEAEEKFLKKKMLSETRANSLGGVDFGSKTSGGNWYFYNPATLSFGMSEFLKKWGSRILEDDWRRKDKKSFDDFETDSIVLDTIIKNNSNTKDPNYYLDRLPKTEEDFQNSDSQIKEAFYNMGIIYRESLEKISLSTQSFNEIFKRFPLDGQYSALSLYNIYLNYNQTNNIEAANVGNELIKKFPESIYSRILLNPKYAQESVYENSIEEKAYNEVFQLYKLNLFSQIIEKTDTISNAVFKNKLLFLRALSLIKSDELDEALNILRNISDSEEELFDEANYLLEAINDPKKMEKANQLALSGSPYTFRTNKEQMIILVLTKPGVDVTYLKTLVSDFHNQSISNETFQISALLLGLDRHILIIKPFTNTKEAINYYHLFLDEATITNVLNKHDYKLMAISTENFKEFYKNKDVEGYHGFFTKNYLLNQ